MIIRGESGFTLAEVMISMCIFAVGILGILNMQLLSTKTNAKSRGMTEAIIVAQNKINELATYKYVHSDLDDRTTGAFVGGAGALGLDDFPINAAANDNADHTDTSNSTYTIYWNVQDDAPFTDTKTIRVIVRWLERGIFYNYSIDTMKANGV